MVSLKFVVLFPVLLFTLLCAFHVAASAYDRLANESSSVVAMEVPDHPSFISDTNCRFQMSQPNSADQEVEETHSKEPEVKPSVKLNLKHISTKQSDGDSSGKKESVVGSSYRDVTRIQTLHRRIVEKKNTVSKLRESRGLENKVVVAPAAVPQPEYGGQLVATLESGVSLGSGEYFMDVFIGTPPKHYSLILDTGSDLNWIQCLPCHDCFEQNGKPYDPKESSSYRDVSCNDARCQLVSSPEPAQACKLDNQSCPYFYWYGDQSNTTGDFALEKFTVNLTSTNGKTEFRDIDKVMFGCGHWNRGLFHGAAGLLGLGRGPLSFSSQLQSLYGHTFSYCLVDRNSDLSVNSKLIFGEDESLKGHPNLNFTSLVVGKESFETFYYIQINAIVVGGEVLSIPDETWKLSQEGTGGTIIDSGTTLTYFADPAYQIIKDAFLKKVKHYPLVTDVPILSPCYNVSGVTKVELPEFAIMFEDGAEWSFPIENYFIRLEPEEIVCLAIMGTPKSSLSILGNYQQQNFHIMYDTKKSRLGFAPMKCADV